MPAIKKNYVNNKSNLNHCRVSSSHFQFIQKENLARHFSMSGSAFKTKNDELSNVLVNKHNKRSSKPTNERKKKQQLKSLGTIDVWRHITVKQLSEAMQKNMG